MTAAVTRTPITNRSYNIIINWSPVDFRKIFQLIHSSNDGDLDFLPVSDVSFTGK